MKPIRAAILLLLAAGLAGSAAQPPRQEPPPPAAHDNDPAAMKARLERWLEETRHREEVIQAALKRLSEGASPEDVRKSMEPGVRPPRNGGREGPGGRAGEPGRAHREGPGGPPRPDARGDEPDREQVLAFIEKQNPEFGARMRAMVKQSPEGADRILGRITPQVREVLAERDEQTREIRAAQLKNGWEVMGAVRQIREAAKSGDDAARAKGVERVRDLLGFGFDLRVRLHEREATVLEERLAKLRQDLVEERAGRDTFIAERLRMITEPRERHEPRPEPRPDSKPQPKP